MPTPFRCVAFHDTLLHTEKPPYRFPHTAADGLFAEQVAVRPGAGKRQHQHIILDTVNEQPVRENVTFPMAHPIAGQIVIAVFIRQRFAHRQQRHSRELILYDAAARYLKELKASGEEITPKEWRREIDLLTAQKQVDSLDMKAMREELKAVEWLRKVADQLARQERDKPRDRGPER